MVPWNIIDQPRFSYRGLLIGEMLLSFAISNFASMTILEQDSDMIENTCLISFLSVRSSRGAPCPVSVPFYFFYAVVYLFRH